MGVTGAGVHGTDWSNVSGVKEVSSEDSTTPAATETAQTGAAIGKSNARARSVDMSGLGLADQLAAKLDGGETRTTKTEAAAAVGPKLSDLKTFGNYEGRRASAHNAKAKLTMNTDEYHTGGKGRISISVAFDEKKKNEGGAAAGPDMLGMFPDVSIKEYQSLFEGTGDVTYDLHDAKFEKAFHRGAEVGLDTGFDYTAHASTNGDTRTVVIDQKEGKFGRGRMTLTVKDGKITDFRLEKWKNIRLFTLIKLGEHEILDDHVTGLHKID